MTKLRINDSIKNKWGRSGHGGHTSVPGSAHLNHKGGDREKLPQKALYRAFGNFLFVHAGRMYPPNFGAQISSGSEPTAHHLQRRTGQVRDWTLRHLPFKETV